jgi:hypothetical protein
MFGERDEIVLRRLPPLSDAAVGTQRFPCDYDGIGRRTRQQLDKR